MKSIIFLLYTLLFLLSLTLVLQGYQILKLRKVNILKRRRWGRIRVPNEKMITCKVAEPSDFTSNTEYLINDINMAGISFLSDKKFEKVILKILVKFPFTSYKEAGTVWGRVVYCNKLEDMEKYRVGVAYIRKNKWPK